MRTTFHFMRRVKVIQYLCTTMVTIFMSCNVYVYALHHRRGMPKCKDKLRRIHTVRRRRSDVTRTTTTFDIVGWRMVRRGISREKNSTYVIHPLCQSGTCPLCVTLARNKHIRSGPRMAALEFQWNCWISRAIPLRCPYVRDSYEATLCLRSVVKLRRRVCDCRQRRPHSDGSQDEVGLSARNLTSGSFIN